MEDETKLPEETPVEAVPVEESAPVESESEAAPAPEGGDDGASGTPSAE